MSHWFTCPSCQREWPKASEAGVCFDRHGMCAGCMIRSWGPEAREREAEAGYKAATCPTCAMTGDPHCPTCQGRRTAFMSPDGLTLLDPAAYYP